jgi:hypothetical protein
MIDRVLSRLEIYWPLSKCYVHKEKPAHRVHTGLGKRERSHIGTCCKPRFHCRWIYCVTNRLSEHKRDRMCLGTELSPIFIWIYRSWRHNCTFLWPWRQYLKRNITFLAGYLNGNEPDLFATYTLFQSRFNRRSLWFRLLIIYSSHSRCILGQTSTFQ